MVNTEQPDFLFQESEQPGDPYNTATITNVDYSTYTWYAKPIIPRHSATTASVCAYCSAYAAQPKKEMPLLPTICRSDVDWYTGSACPGAMRTATMKVNHAHMYCDWIMLIKSLLSNRIQPLGRKPQIPER